MKHKYKLLSINPEAVCTRTALFENEEEISSLALQKKTHKSKKKDISGQLESRTEDILSETKEILFNYLYL